MTGERIKIVRKYEKMIIIILAELPFNCSLIFPKVHSEIYSKRSKPEDETHSPLSAHPKKLTPHPTPSSHVHLSNLLSPLLSSNTQFLDNMVFLVILKDSMLIWVYNSDQNMFWLSRSDVFPCFLFSGQQMVTYSRTRIPPQMQS